MIGLATKGYIDPQKIKHVPTELIEFETVDIETEINGEIEDEITGTICECD